MSLKRRITSRDNRFTAGNKARRSLFYSLCIVWGLWRGHNLFYNSLMSLYFPLMSSLREEASAAWRIQHHINRRIKKWADYDFWRLIINFMDLDWCVSLLQQGDYLLATGLKYPSQRAASRNSTRWQTHGHTIISMSSVSCRRWLWRRRRRKSITRHTSSRGCLFESLLNRVSRSPSTFYRTRVFIRILFSLLNAGHMTGNGDFWLKAAGNQ